MKEEGEESGRRQHLDEGEVLGDVLGELDEVLCFPSSGNFLYSRGNFLFQFRRS